MTKYEIWNKIYGNEYLKRAIEIALTGDHKITIFGNSDNGAGYLKIILEDLLTFMKPCRCENLGNSYKECICSTKDILKHRKTKKYQKALLNPILVKLEQPSTNDYHRIGEAFENVIVRINFNKSTINNKSKCVSIDKIAQDILDTAIIKLSFTSNQVERVLSVAKTIALMDDQQKDCIKVYHISEAIQYQLIDDLMR